MRSRLFVDEDSKKLVRRVFVSVVSCMVDQHLLNDIESI